jgi:hypothetical protein
LKAAAREHDAEPKDMKMKTRYEILMIAAALGAFVGPAFAQTPYRGQRPAPPAVAAQTALP